MAKQLEVGDKVYLDNKPVTITAVGWKYTVRDQYGYMHEVSPRKLRRKERYP